MAVGICSSIQSLLIALQFHQACAYSGRYIRIVSLRKFLALYFSYVQHCIMQDQEDRVVEALLLDLWQQSVSSRSRLFYQFTFLGLFLLCTNLRTTLLLNKSAERMKDMRKKLVLITSTNTCGLFITALLATRIYSQNHGWIILQVTSIFICITKLNQEDKFSLEEMKKALQLSIRPAAGMDREVPSELELKTSFKNSALSTSLFKR